MGTDRRQIPINHGAGHDAGHGAGRQDAAWAAEPNAGGNPGSGAGAGPKDTAAGKGPVSGQASPTHGRAAQAAPTASAAELQAVTAERDTLVAERDALAKERDSLADSLLRLRAEFDNFRRRTSKEVFDAGARAQGDLLVDLLPVLDNLERALDAAEHHEEGKVLDGVRLTRNMFAGLLGRAGVEEIEGQGGPFDPHLHEAVMVQASDQQEGSVAAVLQKGYRQGDRVLRPARVAVSSGNGEPAIAG